jgi:hypothetical protein
MLMRSPATLLLELQPVHARIAAASQKPHCLSQPTWDVRCRCHMPLCPAAAAIKQPGDAQLLRMHPAVRTQPLLPLLLQSCAP